MSAEEYLTTKKEFSVGLKLRIVSDIAANLNGLDGFSFKKEDMVEFAEAYHKSRVDAISDEEIEYQAEIESGFVSGLEGTYEEGKLIGFENGAEFIKSKLKE